jgi:hypothetical protein
MTDRGLWVAGLLAGGNVRRLMYQSLIWPFVLGDDARRLSAALNTQNRQGLANPLIDGVRRDVKLARNFLGRQMLVDEAKAIELAW